MRLAFVLHVGLFEEGPRSTCSFASTKKNVSIESSPAIRDVAHQNTGYEVDVRAVSMSDHEPDRVQV